MKLLLFLGSLFLCRGFIYASTPTPPKPVSVNIFHFTPHQLKKQFGVHLNLRQRMQWAIVRRKADAFTDELTPKQKNARKMGGIAAVAGGLGVIFLFIVPIVGVILGTLGLILGLISLKDNPNRGSSWAGIIGGSVVILILLVAIVAFAGGW